ncbi:MAG: NUDIX hydrolase [Parcubacteria group bacterium]
MEKNIIKIAIVIRDKENPENVLLIKEKVEKSSVAKWNIIKGTCETQKEDIFEAAVRECFEEASVHIRIESSLGCFFVSKEDGSTSIQFNFLASIGSGNIGIQDKNFQKKLGENISEVRWFDKSEIAGMDDSEFVSPRTKLLLDNWMNGRTYPLDSISVMEEK